MKYSYITLIFIISLIGCKGDPVPVGPTLSGDIVGKADMYADNGLRLQDNSGIQVSIDGSSYSTITSTDGSWKLAGVPAGIYTLVFLKTGFITVKYFDLQFVGGGTYYWSSISMGQIPSVTVTQLNLTGPDSNNYFNIQGSLSSADSLSRSALITFDTVPISVSSTTTFLFEEYFDIQPYSTSFSRTLQHVGYFKTEYGLSTGSTLYLRVLVLPRGGNGISYNPFTGKNEMYNSQTSLSKLDSLIVP